MQAVANTPEQNPTFGNRLLRCRNAGREAARARLYCGAAPPRAIDGAIGFMERRECERVGVRCLFLHSVFPLTLLGKCPTASQPVRDTRCLQVHPQLEPFAIAKAGGATRLGAIYRKHL